MTGAMAANVLRFAREAFNKHDPELTVRIIKDLPVGVFNEALIRGAVALDKEWKKLEPEVQQALVETEKYIDFPEVDGYGSCERR